MAALQDLAAVMPAAIDYVWYLLTVLVRIGRPARPAELASRWAQAAWTTLPPPPPLELLELICQMPGSPLLLTEGGFVTVSETAILAFRAFLENAASPFSPRDGIRVSWPGERGRFELKYARKRKATVLLAALPEAKRRLLLPCGRGFDEVEELQDNSRQLQSNNMQICTSKYVNKDDSFVCTTFRTYNPCLLNQADDLPPYNGHELLLSTTMSQSLDPVLLKGGNPKPCGVFTAVALEDLPMITSNQNLFNSTLGASASKGNYIEGVHLCKPLAWLLASSNPTTDAGMMRNYNSIPHGDELISSMPCFPTTEDEQNMPLMGVGMFSSHAVVPADVATECVLHDQCEENVFNVVSIEEAKSVQQGELAAKEERPKTTSISPKPIKRSETSRKPRKPCEAPDVKNGQTSNQQKRGEKIYSSRQKTKNRKDQSHFEEIKLDVSEEIMPNINCKARRTSELKELPSFDSFKVEEEEGSGGYGTVYRTERITDGKIFAIKYPHANANNRHVTNELKMLERYGGRNSVIKLEESFKSGDAQCLVLEHVEHDRPEVLKKEINISELQWYGFCLFRALASLHKEGIVHRDVKPGNFLFSRKLNKGYLIDFNLAIDLNHKYRQNSKVKSSVRVYPLLASFVQSKKPLSSKDTLKKSSGKAELDSVTAIDDGSGAKHRSGQAADISGVTSARDPTSLRTPSAERLKQPMPCKGRKELINFVHEAMCSPQSRMVAASVVSPDSQRKRMAAASVVAPISQRKRVAALPGKINQRLLHLTPMPLYHNGNTVAGAGTLSTGGNVKQIREGPCVGTKGFRAPEVLFKSSHQGYKIDVWSAGVTLLYLIIGRTPFGGDPEQNIKEIAKLRGSEDMWEVAKLHNCEPSFPREMLDVRFMESVDLRRWCEENTRRPEFLDLVPSSLFELVDRCLTPNPRRRIAAEEALMHHFFRPCYAATRRLKSQKKPAAAAAAAAPGSDNGE